MKCKEWQSKYVKVTIAERIEVLICGFANLQKKLKCCKVNIMKVDEGHKVGQGHEREWADAKY